MDARLSISRINTLFNEMPENMSARGIFLNKVQEVSSGTGTGSEVVISGTG